MFSITSRERKVTNYVKEQAYAWLYDKIAKDQYLQQNSNSDLLIKIKMARKIDENTYNEFLRNFNNVPYAYMLNYNQSNFKNIYTRHIDNYFISYNDFPLPAGFIKSFFEDDYETQADVREFYAKYLNETLDDMINGCKLRRNNIDNAIIEVKNQHSQVLQPKLGHHIVNLFIKLVLPIIAFIVCVSGLIGLLVEYKLDISAANALEWLINTFGTALTLVPTIRAIKIIVFYIRWGMLKTDVSSISKMLSEFDSDTLESFKTHFTGINSTLINQRSPFIDDACLDAPAKKKQYHAVIGYDKNKLIAKLEKIEKAYKGKINIIGGKNKWFFSLCNNLLWCVLGIMVNSDSYIHYIESGISWLVNSMS